MRRLALVLFAFTLLLSARSAFADGTYILIVESRPNIQGCCDYLTSGISKGANDSISLHAFDPVQIDSQTRWKLDGYSLDGAPVIYATAYALTMNGRSHTLTWLWHQEFMLALTSNFGQPLLNGTGWQPVNSTVSISAPQTVLEGSNQFLFSQWELLSGTATIADTHNSTTSVTMRTPTKIQAQYALVIASGESTVQLLIKNGANPLYAANVTVTDDANTQIWKGLTDTAGLTGSFTVKTTLIYTVHVQYQSTSYTTHQKFPNSQTYPIDISQGQSPITWARIEPFVFPIIIVIVLVAALVIYLSRRGQPERPQYEWVNR